MKKIFSLFIILGNICAYTQQITVTGLIVDPSDKPLQDVLIKSVGINDNVETYSNEEGYFHFEVPDSVSILSFSKPGYKTYTAGVIANSNLSVTLEYSELSQMSIEEILKTRVKTVSLREEDISEAPGIVTVLTADELKELGIRTIREALLLIPGFEPFQNDDEQILAVRGVFATTSQKILFMRNGHSLNEGNLDIPQMEYSISIENIKKIEVIRGPGASIYGNSAFAAVVNIITKDKEETYIKASFGNHGYTDFDAGIIKKINDHSNFTIWGRYANIEGEDMDVMFNAGNIGDIKGTYKTYSYPMNMDAGFRYIAEHMKTSLSFRRHQYNTYWTIPGDFTNVDSIFWQPHLLQNSLHYDLVLDKKIDETKKIQLQNFVDYSTLSNYRLIGNVTDSTPHGVIQANEWNVLKGGINAFGSWDYSEKGNLIAGLVYEYRKYLDSWLTSNKHNNNYLDLLQEYYPRDSEDRFAGYIQVNHRFTDWASIDLGARYDFAEKFSATFNPRLAAIFYPIQGLSVKAIYTKAFQAPGYSYRNANNAADFSGSLEKLQPERIQTYQASVRYAFDSKSYFEASAYYNQLENIIARRPGEAYYSNFGKLASYGVESEFHYSIQSQTLFVHYGMLLPDTTYMDHNFKKLYIADNRFKNLSEHTLTTGVIFRIKGRIILSTYARYNSEFYSSNNELIGGNIIWNNTLRILNINKVFDVGVSVYNLTDKYYVLGDPSIRPLPQPGRWFAVSLTTKFQ